MANIKFEKINGSTNASPTNNKDLEINKINKGKQMGLDLKEELKNTNSSSTSSITSTNSNEGNSNQEVIQGEPNQEQRQELNIYDQLVEIANGKTSSSDPSTIKGSAQSVYDQTLDYINKNYTTMSDDQRAMSKTYLDNAESNLNDASSLYDSYLESYNNLQDSKSAMQVARDNAYKYTQQYLNNQGLGTQGLAESTYAGIGNQYSNSISNLHKTHNETMSDAYSTYQKMIRDNNRTAINNRDILTQQQNEKAGLEKEEKMSSAIANLDNQFTDSTNPSSMKTALDKYGADLDEGTYESYKQQYVSTLLGNTGMDDVSDVMYNQFGAYFMENEVENGQVFVLQNSTGKDAHYFEYQNGSLVELKKKDVENSNKSYIHFDSKGNHTNQFALKTKERILNADKNQNFKGWNTYPDGTVFSHTTQGVEGVFDTFESYYVKKDGKLYSVSLDGLSDVDKNKLKKTVVNFN